MSISDRGILINYFSSMRYMVESHIKLGLLTIIVGMVVFASSAFLEGVFAYPLQLIGFGIKGFGWGALLTLRRLSVLPRCLLTIGTF